MDIQQYIITKDT